MLSKTKFTSSTRYLLTYGTVMNKQMYIPDDSLNVNIFVIQHKNDILRNTYK